MRRKKEKTLGPATKPKHEALKKLAEYITEYTGKLAKQGESCWKSTTWDCIGLRVLWKALVQAIQRLGDVSVPQEVVQ